MCFKVLICAGVCFSFLTAKAQSDEKGTLTGSFETNSVYYVPDSDLETYAAPKDRIGSNNFLKLGYSRGKITAGIQFELYSPVLQGFSPELKGGKIVGKYVGWSDGDFAVTVGDFYEQFGSGMILRTFEDRALGFNNALEGVRLAYKFGDILRLKALWGRPRLYMDYADVQVRGADASLSLSSLAGWDTDYLALEGSFVNRHENVLPGITDVGSPNTGLWSGRMVYENRSGFFARGEYVAKKGEVVAGIEDYEISDGNGQLLELGYNAGGLGVTATYRRVENMDMRIAIDDNSINNTLNYIPSLTRQHAYMLATLEPHSTHAGGEQGGMVDLFYNFRKGSLLGGRHGLKIHLNGSLLYPEEKSADGKYNLLFGDACFDVEKPWSKKFKTVFLYSWQSYPDKKGLSADNIDSHIFVADLLYKFNSKTSLRGELQYLCCDSPAGDWLAALVELNVAPRWSMFASDMYNHQSEKVHYYNGGISYARSRTRIALSAGRNRAGYICSGGVCRMIPAYTGINLSLTTSF